MDPEKFQLMEPQAEKGENVAIVWFIMWKNSDLYTLIIINFSANHLQYCRLCIFKNLFVDSNAHCLLISLLYLLQDRTPQSFKYFENHAGQIRKDALCKNSSQLFVSVT